MTHSVVPLKVSGELVELPSLAVVTVIASV